MISDFIFETCLGKNKRVLKPYVDREGFESFMAYLNEMVYNPISQKESKIAEKILKGLRCADNAKIYDAFIDYFTWGKYNFGDPVVRSGLTFDWSTYVKLNR